MIEHVYTLFVYLMEDLLCNAIEQHSVRIMPLGKTFYYRISKRYAVLVYVTYKQTHIVIFTISV